MRYIDHFFALNIEVHEDFFHHRIATRDKVLLLTVGGLKEGDPRYVVKFVEVINPPTPGLYMGVRVTGK